LVPRERNHTSFSTPSTSLFSLTIHTHKYLTTCKH
jgi:hypothetical protein